MTAISKRALALFAFAACSVTCVASSAYAQTFLNWNAPAACPDEAAVQSAIGRALDPAAKQHSAVEVDADVEQAGVGYVLTLRVRTASGTSRERLEASDCGLLVTAVLGRITIANGVGFVGVGSQLEAFDVEDGTLLNTIETGGPTAAGVASIANGIVAFGTGATSLTHDDADQGKLIVLEVPLP